jgi:anaerobic glycerol-3-phosphate dehydrogenase
MRQKSVPVASQQMQRLQNHHRATQHSQDLNQQLVVPFGTVKRQHRNIAFNTTQQVSGTSFKCAHIALSVVCVVSQACHDSRGETPLWIWLLSGNDHA